MRKTIFTTIFVVIFAFQFYAQNNADYLSGFQIATPESQEFISDRLNRIDKVIQEYVDKERLAGAVALIARNGKIVYHKAIGYNDIETKIPMKKDAIFRIASQTKAITSVAIMILYEEGKFLLDDPLSKYIPEFKNPNVIDKYNESDTTYTTIKAKREITIRDLLTHTSGIGYAQIGNKMMNSIYFKEGIVGGIGVNQIILGDKMRKLGSLPLFHQPGEKFTYGLNTDLLGYLVEVISGMNLDKFFRKRIFEPLGMNDTYFYLPPEKQNRLANLYTEDSTKKLVKMKEQYYLNGIMNRDYPKMNGTYFSGGGGLSSTAYDYAIFMQMLLNGGEYKGKRILSRNTIRMMTMNQIGDLSSSGVNKFGLGFGIVTESGSSKLPTPVGVYSWGGMFSSSYWIDPKEKIVCQLFIQKYPNSYSDIHDKFKVLVYQALK